MPQSNISRAPSTSDGYQGTETPMSWPSDPGSPVPSLVESTPPYRHRPLHRPNSTRPEDVQGVASTRRWESTSSAGSSRKRVETTTHPTSRGSTSFPNGNLSRTDLRPSVPDRNRHSMMSFASTAPSLQLQTPGLQQDAFPFPPTSLAVSVEEYDEDDTNDGHGASQSHHDNDLGGGKEKIAVRGGGTMVVERRRQFEAQKQAVATRENQKEGAMPTDDPKSSLMGRSHTAAESSNGSSATSITVNLVATHDIANDSQRSSGLVKDFGFTDSPVPESSSGIGLGLQGLTKPSVSANSWHDDMARLEQDFKDTADSFTSLGAAGYAKAVTQPSASQQSLALASSPGSIKKSYATSQRASKFLTPSRSNAQRDETPVSTVSPPKTPSRASSNKLPATIRLLNLSRPGSPFPDSVKSSISPSQSILNLSQKGLASARRQQWEATTTSNPPSISPLRLSRHSGSAAPISRTSTRPPSLSRNLADVKADSQRSESVFAQDASTSAPPSRILSAKTSDGPQRAPPKVLSAEDQENIDPQPGPGVVLATSDFHIKQSPETARGSALSNSKTRRKPAPTVGANFPTHLIRSPSQAATLKSYAVAAAVNAESGSQGSTGTASIDRMRRTLEASRTTPPPQPPSRRGIFEAHSPGSVAQATVLRRTESSQKSSITPCYLTSGSTTLVPTPEVKALSHLESRIGTPETRGFMLPSTSAISEAPTHLGRGRMAEAEYLEQRASPLSVRNPDTGDDANIAYSPSYQPGADDASYFSFPTGVGISALPIPQEQPTFALAKTYTDRSPLFTPGLGYAIPTSPDPTEQTSRNFADKVYSKSPLSKSPGKGGFVGKMVGAAKKVVNTGIKHRGGNINRMLHGDRLTTPGTPSAQRINSNDSSPISLVPSAVQRQEAQDLQPRWGQEEYLRHTTQEPREFVMQSIRVNLPPVDKERELPPLPQGRPLSPSEAMTVDAESEGSCDMAYDGIVVRRDMHRHQGSGDGTRDSTPDPTRSSMEGVRVEPKEVELAPLIRESALDPTEEEESSRFNIPESTPSLATSAVGAHLLSAQNLPPVTDERAASIFRPSKMPRRVIKTTLPPLLGSPPGSDARDLAPRVFPPAMPLPVPTPVPASCRRPSDPTPRDEKPVSHWQVPVMAEDSDGEGMENESSPTKTEQCRNVERWAQGAADATPPLRLEPHNDNQEAALRRDEDRLVIGGDVRSTPQQTEHRLPSPPPVVSSLPSNAVTQFENDAPGEGMEEQPRHLPGHFTAYEGLEVNLPSSQATQTHGNGNFYPVSSVQDLPQELLPTPDGETLTPEWSAEQNRTPHLDIEALQTLQSIHDTMQALQHSHESAQLDGSFKEAVMASKYQTHEILAKTDALLGMVSDLEQRLSERWPVGGPSTRATGQEGRPPLQGSADAAVYLDSQTPQSQDVASSSRQLGLMETSDGDDKEPTLRQQLEHLAVSMDELKLLQTGTSSSVEDQRSEFASHLQMFAGSANGFHEQLAGDMRNLQGNVENVLQATAALHQQQESLRVGLGLGPPGDSLDLKARLDHLYGMLASVHASAGTQEMVASRIDHVINVLSAIQNKPEPPPPITIEAMTAIIERQNGKHIDLLRSIVDDLNSDMHKARGRMVQELSAATAVEVERHVASMNAELKEKREELDRLESQRKEAEETIADLLRLQSRYKGPASPPNAPRSRPRPMTPARPMPGAMPVQATAPIRPPSRGIPHPSVRSSTRPLPTPSPRPFAP